MWFVVCGVGKAEMQFAGWQISLKNLSLDVGSQTLRVEATLQAQTYRNGAVHDCRDCHFSFVGEMTHRVGKDANHVELMGRVPDTKLAENMLGSNLHIVRSQLSQRSGHVDGR